MSDNERQAHNSAGARDTLRDLIRFIAIVVVLILPFCQDRANYQYSVEQEVLSHRVMLTSTGSSMVQSVAKSFYSFVMDDLHVYPFLRNTLLDNGQSTSDQIIKLSRFFLVVSDRIVENTPLLVYQIGFRFGMAAYWVVFLLPFIGGAVYSGVQYWRKAMDEPRSSRVERFMIYRSVAKIIVFTFLIYLVVPTVGSMTWIKYIVPGGIVIIALMINKMVSVYHRMV